MVEIVGNAVRTAILRALSQQPMTGREVARTIDVGHTTVQRYLTHLETHGLVRPETSTPAGRRQGQHVVWSVDRDRITEIGQQWISYAAALDVPDSDKDQGESSAED